MLENGKYDIIKNVTLQQLEIPETTYNFEVEDYHTYYVGNSSILTHNIGNCGSDLISDDFKMANRGHSRGRHIPNNLNEQLAIQDAMARPLDGMVLKKVAMTDKRWLESEGWVKMQQVYKFADGTSATIHYVMNQSLMLIDEFKFSFP